MLTHLPFTMKQTSVSNSPVLVSRMCLLMWMVRVCVKLMSSLSGWLDNFSYAINHCKMTSSNIWFNQIKQILYNFMFVYKMDATWMNCRPNDINPSTTCIWGENHLSKDIFIFLFYWFVWFVEIFPRFSTKIAAQTI